MTKTKADEFIEYIRSYLDHRLTSDSYIELSIHIKDGNNTHNQLIKGKIKKLM